jgi:hypothetical protein
MERQLKKHNKIPYNAHMRETQKEKPILVYLKTNICSTKKYGGYKQYKYSLIYN